MKLPADTKPVEATPLALHEDSHPMQLGSLAVDSPADVVRVGHEIAKELAAVIKDQELFTVIQGKAFIHCEGWTTCAAMMGYVAREVDVVVDDDGSVTAWVEFVRVSDGVAMGRASGHVGVDEPLWMAKPLYARRSFAVTRATGKAGRLMFSWIMKLAGYEPTPREEIQS